MKLLPKWKQGNARVLLEKEGMSYAGISAESDPPVDGTDGRSLGIVMWRY
jgi:hypothetical protein